MASVASRRDQSVDIVERVSFQAYEEGNLAVIDELVSEDFALYDPLSPDVIRGRDGMKGHIEENRTTFSDIETTIEHLICEDEWCAVHFTFRGTHTGEYPGIDIEPSGATVTVEGMEFDRVEDGKLVETRLLYDTLGLMEQLGVVSETDLADSS